MLNRNRCVLVGALALTAAIAAAPLAEAQQRDGERRGDGQRQGQRGDGQRRPQGGFFAGGRPPGGPGGGLDRISLMNVPQVRDELKISEEQQFFIDELMDEHRAKSREVFSGVDFRSLRDKSEEERRKLMEDLQAKRRKVVQENEEVLSELLSEQQNKRIGEIVLQLQGVRALTGEGVARELDLSGEQKEKIQEAFKAGDDERRKLFEGLRGGGDGGRRPGGADFNAMREKVDAVRKKTDESVMAVLSAEQKQKLDSMKGAKFELDRAALFRRGGGGQGGGRPGGEDRRRDGEGRRRGDGGGGRDQSEGDRPRRPAAE